jgi:pimeloyl-ACP methyl ester carboxylesterase
MPPLTHYRQYRTRASVAERWAVPTLIGAATLAASYLVVRSKTRQAEHDNPATGKFIEVDGVRLHYTERGSGPPLVLLHGNGILAKDFDTSGIASLAARHYRVIAFDRPGYGHSERPRSTIWTPNAQAALLARALHQLGVEQPIVMGHSWGTLVALAMALDYPADVRALVLVSGYYYPSVRLDAPPALPILGDLLRYTLAPVLGRLMWPALVRRIFKPASVPDSFRQLPPWMMLRPSQLRASAAESALMIPAALKLSRRYGELKVPMLIVAGSDDAVANPHHNAERLHEHLPHSLLRLAPGQGYMVHYADPQALVEAIDELHWRSGARARPGLAEGARP